MNYNLCRLTIDLIVCNPVSTSYLIINMDEWSLSVAL